MSNKLMTVFGVFVAGLATMAATTQGCGGGSAGSGDLASVCNQGCTKLATCTASGSSMDACLASCNAQANCSNVSAIVAAEQKCIGMTDCTAAGACIASRPTCVTGSGGTSGGAGTSGSAGTSGGAGITGGGGVFGTGGILGTAGIGGTTCATACAKADACCMALGTDGGACNLKMMCDSATATNMAQIVSGCNAVLEIAAFAGAQEPAACK
jgi:hypothetical protein